MTMTQVSFLVTSELASSLCKLCVGCVSKKPRVLRFSTKRGIAERLDLRRRLYQRHRRSSRN
jgi:hypothetical protein